MSVFNLLIDNWYFTLCGSIVSQNLNFGNIAEHYMIYIL